MGFKGVKSVGLGYFIFSAFNFWNLMLLYNYLNIEIPTPVKVFMEKIFSQLIFHGIFALFGVFGYISFVFFLMAPFLVILNVSYCDVVNNIITLSGKHIK